MRKIRFADNTEINISDVAKTDREVSVKVEINEENTLDSVVETFSDQTKTAVMRYYVGDDLMDGYAGYTKMQNAVYQPNVTTSIDYEQTYPTTESGFAETKVNLLTVTMQKASAISIVSQQTDQNTANIDYIAMETGVDL